MKYFFFYFIDIIGFYCFLFYELKNVINNFDERFVFIGGNKMGEGGFGVVYKGYVNNRMVVVKKFVVVSYIFRNKKN